MAERTIKSFLTSEEIFDLGNRLQRLGLFVVDPRHLIQAHHVQDLLVALQVDGEKLTIDRLKTILAPIFCGTPEQQRMFYAFFEDWIRLQPQILQRLNFEIPEVSPKNPIRQKITGWAEKPKRRRLSVSAAVLTLAIVIVSLIIFKHKPQPKINFQSVDRIGRIINREKKTPVSNAQVFFRNDTLALSNLKIRGPQKLSGQVLKQEDRQPIPAVSVFFMNQQTRTDRQGRFRFRYQPKDSTIQIVFRHPDYMDEIFSYRIHGYDLENIEILLRPEPTAEVDSLIAVVARINAFATSDANKPKLRSWQKFVHQYFPWLRLGSFALPLIIFMGWLVVRWFRLRIILERLSTIRKRQTESVMVKGKADYLYRNALFRRMVQRYRLHREEPSADLDVPATVEATIRQGGLFLQRYAFRKMLPEYLALIDRTSFSDQHAAMLDSLIQRMRSDGVVIDRYYFDDDPHICQSDKPEVPHVTLQELLARHSQHRLLLFSDAEHFIDVRTGKPQSSLEQFLAWSDPAIFIPDQSEGAEYLELTLKDLGFHIGPANLNGLTRHIDALHFPMATEQATWQHQQFPELLLDRPNIWLERQAPDAEQIELLIQQLKNYLDADAMIWLCACAVYPELHWELTLYLATRLNLADDRFPSDEQQEKLQRQLLDLTRLPWFRYGVMPDWLRLRLITELNPQQHQAVRKELRILLESAQQDATDGLKLEFVKRTPADPLADLITPLSRKLGLYRDESPLRDYIFSNYISAGKAGLLSVLIPEKVRRYFFYSGQIMLGVRPLAVLALTLLLGLLGWMGAAAVKTTIRQPFLLPTFQVIEQRTSPDQGAFPARKDSILKATRQLASQSADKMTFMARSDSTLEYYVTGGFRTANKILFTENFASSFQRYRAWLKSILKDSITFNDSLFAFFPDVPGSRFITALRDISNDSLRNAHLLLIKQGQIFRSEPRELYPNDVRLMFKKYNFYCKDYSWNTEFSNPDGAGFDNLFELSDDSLVVHDKASGLLWQRGGSEKYLYLSQVQSYIDSLNQIKFAGYYDWRLPTLEEAMSLMERNQNKSGYYFSEFFDRRQLRIWTADLYAGTSRRWIAGFDSGYCDLNVFDRHDVRVVRFGQSSSAQKIDIPSKNTVIEKPLEKTFQLFRSTYKTLSKDEVQQILKEYNFYCAANNPEGAGFVNNFKVINNRLVYDKATGLMWQRGGSEKRLYWYQTRAYIDSLNQIKFAGYNDWRLPTLEEAMSLMERNKNKSDLFINGLFDSHQWWIWTTDENAGETGLWIVAFHDGYCLIDDLSRYFVRAVRFG